MIDSYTNVTSHLSQNLASQKPAGSGASPISHTMLDLLIVFVPDLPRIQSATLFFATATSEMLEHADATVQKKSYRLLKRLIEGGRLGVEIQDARIEEFVEKFNDFGGGVGPGAQRVCFLSVTPCSNVD